MPPSPANGVRPQPVTTRPPTRPWTPATAPARGVTTEFGGLPYLLHLAGRCGLPERAATGELSPAPD